jgi:hypothetical protein
VEPSPSQATPAGTKIATLQAGIKTGKDEITARNEDRSSQLLQYKCDWCGREKKPHQRWIVGLAGERKGVTATRRQLEMLKKWDAQWAAHPLAVHFCSEKHKEKYVEALFTAPWPSVRKQDAARAAFLRRNAEPVREKMSEAVIERHIADQEPGLAKEGKTGAPKRRRKQRTKKLPKDLFAATDAFYARSLGIILDPPADRGRDASRP